MNRFCRRLLLTVIFLAAAPPPDIAASPKRPVSEFSITYAKSPFTDFLYYLLYRSVGFNGEFEQLKQAVPLDSISPIAADSSFMPQDASISNVTSCDQLYALAEKHDNPEVLKSMLRKAEPQFPAFLAYWRPHIAPAEDRTISASRKEQRRWPPVAHLETMERLKFPFKTMRFDVFALETQGGSMQVPPTIFSTTDIPGWPGRSGMKART